MKNVVINKLVIVGVGLIGGSFALALRKAELAAHIVGVGRSRENMARALKRGLIDEIAETFHPIEARGYRIPRRTVGQTGEIMRRFPHTLNYSIVTDAGAQKDVIAAARSIFLKPAKFRSGHPCRAEQRARARLARPVPYQNVV